MLLEDMWVPPTDVLLADRHVLVVMGGKEHAADLRALHGYIRETRPVFIGVESGADLLREQGFKPDIILGNLERASDESLTSGAQLIAHASLDGTCTAQRHLEYLGVVADRWLIDASGEEMALLLAYHSGAELIVVVGSHARMDELTEKTAHDLNSLFLVRMKVGDKLVDAKGVSKLYRTAPGIASIGIVVAAALVTVVTVFAISPQLRASIDLIVHAIRHALGTA